jgi:hypothetical protein
VNQQLSPDTQAAGEPTEHPGQRRWNNLDGARKRVSGITESGALNALTWAILYILRVIVVTLCVVAVVLLPILIFGGERPTSIKGYVDSITWGWLTLNGVPPKLGSATITLIPWGLAVIPWALLFRAGRSFSLRTNHANRWRVIGAVIMVMTYVASITAAAHLTTSINVSFSSSWALIVSVLMGVSAISIGVLRGGSVHFAAPIPPLALFVARRGAGVILTLMGLAAILLSVRLLTNYSSVVDLFTGLNPGWSGILGLLALTLGYLPVLIVWSAAYIVGAGFSIGPDVMVSPFIPVTAPTQLPPFPPLVAIPETAGAVAWALPVLVVVIGILCGVGISKSLCKGKRAHSHAYGVCDCICGGHNLLFLGRAISREPRRCSVSCFGTGSIAICFAAVDFAGSGNHSHRGFTGESIYAKSTTQNFGSPGSHHR